MLVWSDFPNLTLYKSTVSSHACIHNMLYYLRMINNVSLYVTINSSIPYFRDGSSVKTSFEIKAHVIPTIATYVISDYTHIRSYV